MFNVQFFIEFIHNQSLFTLLRIQKLKWLWIWIRNPGYLLPTWLWLSLNYRNTEYFTYVSSVLFMHL
jgi:hypothetical protein